MSLPEVPLSAVFDIETKEIGDPYEIEASAMVIIMSDDPKRQLWFDEDNMREGAEWLIGTPHITSFNGITKASGKPSPTASLLPGSAGS